MLGRPLGCLDNLGLSEPNPLGSEEGVLDRILYFDGDPDGPADGLSELSNGLALGSFDNPELRAALGPTDGALDGT